MISDMNRKQSQNMSTAKSRFELWESLRIRGDCLVSFQFRSAIERTSTRDSAERTITQVAAGETLKANAKSQSLLTGGREAMGHSRRDEARRDAMPRGRWFHLLLITVFVFAGSTSRTFAQCRSPQTVAEQLASAYGHRLEQVSYISALPLVAKLEMTEILGETRFASEVRLIMEPFRTGKKSPVPKSGSEQAGHLIFAALAHRSSGAERERWIALCRSAADQIFDDSGKALDAMPFHSEMSDAVFMAGPILAVTGKLTGDRRYFDAAAIHLASMRTFCLREDGLYRHSPLCDAAWGRGNGFAALGLALSLSEWPDDHPAFEPLLKEFRKHIAALKPLQDSRTHCWHQVIDHPESYNEYSCTCMIAFSMARGIRRGWLDREDYQSNIDRAWLAIESRTNANGDLTNVCTGTGKQKTLQDYFDRPAINGKDDRGGAVGLMFAVELISSNQP